MTLSIPKDMRAYRINEPGGTEQLILTQMPLPDCPADNVLIRVRAFGLNRSEWFTRRGDSPNVRFPRVLGIECVGEIVDGGNTDLKIGQRVAAMMGGMGRDFDGSYAEYIVIPRQNVFALQTTLPWKMLGALPEMLQTTHGSLYTALQIEHAENLLVRGGTSSIGFAAIALGCAAGLNVCATTRTMAKTEALITASANHVLIDKGEIAAQARQLHPHGFDRVLELVGTTTLLDSLRATRRGGTVCMTSMLGGEWVLPNFNPLSGIPTAVNLTTYSGEATDISESKLQECVDLVESGKLTLTTGPVFRFEQLLEAHRRMGEDTANGKIVIVL